MYSIKINNDLSYKTEVIEDQITIEGEAFEMDLIAISENRFHLIVDKVNYLAEVLEVNYAEKKFKIKVNTGIYDLEVKDKFDALLKNLGLDNLNTQKLKEIKAPMPGLVLKILVEPDADVKKGDNLLILEAMKMENIIKAPSDFKVKKINIKAGETVEKNQVLLVLD